MKLRDANDAIIPPGDKLLSFDIVPLLSETESYSDSLKVLGMMIAGERTPPTSIIIQVAQSDGSMNELTYPLDANSLWALLLANSNRCSAVKEPDFLNGCIGRGDSPEDVPD